MIELQNLLDVLSQLRLGPQPEELEIHQAISRMLDAKGIAYIHEFRLGPGQRIDFLCGSIGIEVKKGRPSATRLRAQLTRYLSIPSVSAAIVVLQRPCPLPETLCGKPLRILALNRLWGVALP